MLLKVLSWLFLLNLLWMSGSCESAIQEQDNELSTIPTCISIPAIEVKADVLEYTNEMVEKSNGSVNPDYMNEVAWWSGGGKPLISETDKPDNPEVVDFTVYLYGHSSNNDDRKVVFDDLDLLMIGDQIFLDTEAGQFVYVVDNVFILEKADFTSDPRVLEDIPGRLLLISCWRSWSGAAPTTENVVVSANLLNQ